MGRAVLAAAVAFVLAAAPCFAAEPPPCRDCPACPEGQAVPALDPAPVPPAPGQPLRILAIGSSTVAGVGASDSGRTWTARLAALLSARRGPAQMTAAGVGGETAAGALVRLRGLLAAQDFDLVIWQAGANDARDPGLSGEAYAATLDAGLAAIRADGAAALLLDAQAWPADPDPARTARFAALTAEAAARAGVPLFPRHAVTAAWAPEVRAAFFAPDGLHHDDRGHACLAELMAAALAGGG
jgi:lysophospholipase L1-like esterase